MERYIRQQRVYNEIHEVRNRIFNNDLRLHFLQIVHYLLMCNDFLLSQN